MCFEKANQNNWFQLSYVVPHKDYDWNCSYRVLSIHFHFLLACKQHNSFGHSIIFMLCTQVCQNKMEKNKRKSEHMWPQEMHLKCMLRPGVIVNVSQLIMWSDHWKHCVHFNTRCKQGQSSRIVRSHFKSFNRGFNSNSGGFGRQKWEKRWKCNSKCH